MQKKILVTFNSTWVLSKRDACILPVKSFLIGIKKIFDTDVVSQSLTECEFVVKNEAVNEAEIKEKLVAFIKEEFRLETIDGVAELSVSDYVPGSEPAKPAEPVKAKPTVDSIPDAPAKPAEAAAPAKPVEEPAAPVKTTRALDAIIEKINGLVGAEEFKQLAAECVKVAPGLIKHNALEALTHQSYLFAINDGNGLSTYLGLFADLLSELGFFKFGENNRIEEIKVPAPQANKDDPFSVVNARFQNYRPSCRVLCIDISEWMTKVGEKQFRDFLSNIYDHMGEHVFIFRVPFVEKEILVKLRKTLGDILFIRDVSFVPFDSDELTQCAEDSLKSRGYVMEDDAWEVFRTRISEEKTDGRFYGINTVNKVIREMIYRKQLDNAFSGIDDNIIKKSEILSLAASYSENEKDGMTTLSEMIGMDAIVKRVEEIVGQIEMTAKHRELGYPCIHMRFVGNPGTGKTTVARVIGKILKEKGILRNGNFFEYAGRDFCGRYVGETAPKTAAMCRDAYGSVLFIDEAYTLYRGDRSTVDYGREAIDTLIAEMENHRNDLVVIMAGYPDEMNELMKANAGLESRMPFIIEFPNYTREQLFQIFMQMVNKTFKYQEGFEEAVKEYFDSLSDDLITAKEFSNARFVRNLFERTWGKAVLRAQLNKEDAAVLRKEDFLLASSEKEFNKIMVKQKPLGFI
ncbi:MAG: AAA family ATPase [Clostridia bacterium]|nr:AAA family ATPase [Clostridia bacterium]